MAYVRRPATLGDDVNPDTAAYRALHDAAVAAANAKRYGTADQAASAKAALTDLATKRAADVAAQKQRDSQPGFFDQLTDVLGESGKWVAIAGASVLAILLLSATAPLLGAMRRPLRNRPRRRRRRGR